MTDEPAEIEALRERAKELRCLHAVAAALARREDPPQVAFVRVLAAIPSGWQFADDTTCRIEFFSRSHAREDFVETPWRLRSPILIAGTEVGAVEVVYKHEHPNAFEGPFLPQERELLDAIAHRLGEFLEWKQRELGGERIGAEPPHWRWRERFAERIAERLDPARFGVEKMYLYGSTQNGSAGVGSDIDLLVVHRGNEEELRALQLWLEGWSLCLSEVSFQLTGVPSEGFLDVHVVDATEAPTRLRAMTAASSPPRELPLGAAALRSRRR